jgi:hypothetical protein
MTTPRQERERLRDEKRNKLPERKAYKKAWSEKHPPDKTKRNARYRELMQTDEGYRRRKRCHRYVSTYIVAIKAGKEVKKPSCVKLIGCNSSGFKQFIESQFEPGMSWSNHGTLWTVDHIVPLKFNTPEVYRYTNCRPLWKDRHKARPLDLSDVPRHESGYPVGVGRFLDL